MVSPFTPQILVEGLPSQQGIQFMGGYWPGMSLDDFEAAYKEVAEPLYNWVRDNWLGSYVTQEGIQRLEEGIQSWLSGNVPREIRHPVVGATVLTHPNDPNTITISLAVATPFTLLNDKLLARGGFSGDGPSGGGFASEPVFDPEPESDGWDEDPLGL